MDNAASATGDRMPASQPPQTDRFEPPPPEVVHAFWFQESPARWWSAEPGFDEVIRSRFAGLIHQAAQGELHAWRDEPAGRLAEIIVLDQFSRNAFRGSAQAFAQDPMALVLAQEAVRQGVHAALSPQEATFLLMPFMHSESRKIHEVAERLFREFTPAGNHAFELRHKAIIDRFGRYPHRNALLGRVSTEEELAFLQQPGSSF
jgi:uncharacterized protein (DUF924 family)